MRVHEFLPLTFAVYHILVALSEGKRHGYGIIQEVEAQTDGRLRMPPGTLYGAISRLVDQGLIEEIETEEERRRYYQLTDLGLQVMVAEARRLEALVKLARSKHILPVEGGPS
jgi:DNA-binding PadR family transcriptional regulator